MHLASCVKAATASWWTRSGLGALSVVCAPSLSSWLCCEQLKKILKLHLDSRFWARRCRAASVCVLGGRAGDFGTLIFLEWRP